MAVLVLAYVENIATIVSGVAEIHLAGRIISGNTSFGSNGTLSPVSVNVNCQSYTLNEDIQTAAATAMTSSPYSLTFGAGDVVRLLPASG